MYKIPFDTQPLIEDMAPCRKSFTTSGSTVRLVIEKVEQSLCWRWSFATRALRFFDMLHCLRLYRPMR